MRKAIAPSEVLWEETIWGSTGAHLSYQLSEKTTEGQVKGETKVQRGSCFTETKAQRGSLFTKASSSKRTSHLTLPHRYSPCKTSRAESFLWCQAWTHVLAEGTGTEYPDKALLLCEFHIFPAIIHAIIPNMQRQKNKATINHMRFRFEWNED